MHIRNTHLALLLCLLTCLGTKAQTTDTTEFKPHGNLWGLAFGDFAYKANADTVGNGLGRGTNQYSRMPADSRLFQLRRVYLGYNYDITKRLSAEVLLAAEEDIYPGSVGNQTNNGDVLQDNKFAPYVKLANVRWKEVFKGSDIVFGEVATPAFPMLTETTWGYRCIERTVADIRRTPSSDLGIALQGHFDKDTNFGYNIMVGNGAGAVPENNQFQWFYGDVWAKFFNKRLIIDIYQDYEKLNWMPAVDSETDIFHHDRNMTKIMIAYTTRKLTVGVEAFQNTILGDVNISSIVSGHNKTYYRTTMATAFSVFARGRLYKNKLGFFARYDNFDPTHKLKDVTNTPNIVEYTALTSQYDPTTKEQFVTLGIDYTPFDNLHIMPNFYMNTYQCALTSKYYGLNPRGSGNLGTDAVYRITVYYLFGKKESVRF